MDVSWDGQGKIRSANVENVTIPGFSGGDLKEKTEL